MAWGLVQIWHLLSLLKARIQVRSAANFKLRIALLVAFSALNVAVGAALYRWASGNEESWYRSLFTVYAVFATILAMISDEVNSALLAVRSGRTQLKMEGHILLLNWNNLVPFILKQLESFQGAGGRVGGYQQRHPFAGRPLVILADKDKEDMDDLVLSFMKTNKLEIHTQHGKPYKLEHLAQVSAAEARAVLVLHPEAEVLQAPSLAKSVSSSLSGLSGGGDLVTAAAAAAAAERDGPAVLKLQTVMALATELMGKKSAVVVQVPENSAAAIDSGRLQALDRLLGRAGQAMHLQDLPVCKMVNSLCIWSALQPWTATMYDQIIQNGKQPNLACVHLPQSLFTAAAAAGSAFSPASSSLATQHRTDLCTPLLETTSTTTLNRGAAARRPATPAKAARWRLQGRASGTAGVVTYGHVRAKYSSDMIAFGFYSSSRRALQLNPSDDAQLDPGDVLVALIRARQHSSPWWQSWSPVLPDGNQGGASSGCLAPAWDSSSSVVSFPVQGAAACNSRSPQQQQQQQPAGNTCPPAVQPDCLARRMAGSPVSATSCSPQAQSAEDMSNPYYAAAAAPPPPPPPVEAARQQLLPQDDFVAPPARVSSRWSFTGTLNHHLFRRSTACDSRAARLASVAEGSRQQRQVKPPLNILVVGYPAAKVGQELLPLFLNFSPPGSRITVSVAEPPCGVGEGDDDDGWLPEGYDRMGTLRMLEQPKDPGIPAVEHLIHYRFLQVAAPTSTEGLQQAGLLAADALLLAAQDMPWNSPAEADAHILGTLVEIEELLTTQADQEGRATTAVLGGGDGALQVGEVESSVLVQVANEPLYGKVVQELLGQAAGCELYLVPPSHCGFRAGELLQFAEVQEVGRLMGKTVVGVVAQQQIVLAPCRKWRWRVADQDRVAVIAEDWYQ
eukprot:gene1867-2204_t